MNTTLTSQILLIAFGATSFMGLGRPSVEAGSRGQYEVHTANALFSSIVNDFLVLPESNSKKLQGKPWLTCDSRSRLLMQDEDLFKGSQEEKRAIIGSPSASAGDTLLPIPPLLEDKAAKEKDRRIQRFLNETIPGVFDTPKEEFTLRHEKNKMFFRRQVPDEKKKGSLWGLPPTPLPGAGGGTTSSAGDTLPPPRLPGTASGSGPSAGDTFPPPRLPGTASGSGPSAGDTLPPPSGTPASPTETNLDLVDYRIESGNPEGPQQVIAVRTQYGDYAAEASRAGWKPVLLEVKNKNGEVFIEAKQTGAPYGKSSIDVQVKIGNAKRRLKEGQVAQFDRESMTLFVKVTNSTALISRNKDKVEGPPYGLSLKVWSERNPSR